MLSSAVLSPPLSIRWSTTCSRRCSGTGENAAKIAYGSFLQAVFNFLMVAICIFIFVKIINRFYRKNEAEKEARPAPRLCPYCFGEINDKATRCPHCTSELPKE